MLLSIIIPVFNAEDTITNCIESLLQQSFRDYEIIIVNDGSTDNTEKIINEFASKYSFIRIVNQENGGQANARNSGINLAVGTYISFVDADDVLEINDMYENYLDILCKNYEIDLLQFPTKWINKSDELITDNIDKIISGKENIKFSFLKDELRGMPCNKIYKRSLFNKVHFAPTRFFEDTWFIMDLLPFLNHICFTSYGYYSYITREGSEMNSKFSKLKYLHLLETRLRNLSLFNEQEIDTPLYIDHFFALISSYLEGSKEYGNEEFSKFDNQILDSKPSFRSLFNKKGNLKNFIKFSFLNIFGLKILSLIFKNIKN